MIEERKKVQILALIVGITLSTLFIRIPLPTGGYFNFGDVLVVFSALLFGKKYGFIMGGVGSAIADIVGGFAIFSPLTFLAKGFEGFFAGLSNEHTLHIKYLFLILSALSMVLIYFIGEIFMPEIGLSLAIAEIIPNLIQSALGVIFGFLLYKMYHKVF